MKMDEAISVSCIIDKLPYSWKDFKHTLKHGKEELSLIQLGSHLRIEEALWMQESGKPKDSSSVHMAEEEESSARRKGRKRPWRNTKGDSNKKTKVSCWICGKAGHFKRDCPTNKSLNHDKQRHKSGSKDQGTSTSKGRFLDLNLDIAVNSVSLISEAFYVQDDEVAWWIDSGANRHVCKDRHWFKTYKASDDDTVLHIGNESTAPIVGRGLVVLELSSGKSLELRNVLHVPKIRKNLVSGSMLNRYGYKQVYESDRYVLSKGGVFVGFGHYNNGMFMLNVNNTIVNDNAFLVGNSDFSLWHARLGHVNYKRLTEMSKEGILPSFDVFAERCKTCMLTKITRQPFTNIQRKSVMIELIHSDLCDLHSTPTIGGKKYVINFIDDYSRYCYTYLLNSKDEALEKFRVFKTEVELQQGI